MHDSWLLVFTVAAILIFVAVSQCGEDRFRARCEARGGQYVYQARNPSLCLRKGVLLND